MEKKGLVALAWYDSGARSFYNSQKPITEPSRCGEGMKIRVMNNDLYSGMIQALGGNPSPMAFSEVYQSLKTGVSWMGRRTIGRPMNPPGILRSPATTPSASI